MVYSTGVGLEGLVLVRFHVIKKKFKKKKKEKGKRKKKKYSYILPNFIKLRYIMSSSAWAEVSLPLLMLYDYTSRSNVCKSRYSV